MPEASGSYRHTTGDEVCDARRTEVGLAWGVGAALAPVRFLAIRIGLVFLAVGALLAAACGGGGSDDLGTSGSPTQGPSGRSELVVNSHADTDERDGVLTLREAVLLATGVLSASELDPEEAGQVQGDPGPESGDVITFADSFQDGEAIVLAEPLSPLASGFDVIDGSAVDGVVIDGDSESFTCIEIDSSGNALLGLQIVGCRTGILVGQQAEENRIGGSEAGQGNIISGNVVGIELRGRANVIQGNLIGLDASGAEPVGNEFEGIWVTPVGRENIIGGPNPGEGNVISGNTLFGISIDGAKDNVLQGNLIGLDLSGSEGVANKYGITVQAGATGNVIGGDGMGERNVISANNTGLLLRGPETSGNVVRGNYFGTDAAGDGEIANVVDVWELEDIGENVLEENQLREQP